MPDKDQLSLQYRDALKWSKCLRSVYPTLMFYFMHTYNDTIAIYYWGVDDNTIKTVYTHMTVEAISASGTPLPENLEPHLQLIPVGDNCYTIPGILDTTPWKLTADHRLVQGDSVLIATTGAVVKTTSLLKCMYIISIHRPSKQLEWSQKECTPAAKNFISELKNVSFTSALKMIIG
jgi:hypothetical protein